MMENKIWLSKILEVLQEFSSREFQEKIWRHGLGPEVSSYEDAMCKLFDDLGFSRLIDIEWRQSGLSESQMLILKEFRENLLKFDKDIPEIPRPTDILDRPSWEGVRAYAMKATKSLGFAVGSITRF